MMGPGFVSCVILLLLLQVSGTFAALLEDVFIYTVNDNVYTMNITGGTAKPYLKSSAAYKNFLAIAYNWKTPYIFASEVGDKVHSDYKHLLYINVITGRGKLRKVPGRSRPLAIACDFISNTIYYTDKPEGEVNIISADHTYARILMASLTDVSGIAVDPIAGMLFVSISPPSTLISGSIVSAYMDGSERKTIINTDIRWPQSLTIDQQDKWLYWTDTILSTIEKCRYNGTLRETILDLKRASPLLSLTLDATFIYFVIAKKGQIYRVPKMGGTAVVLGPDFSSSIPTIHDLVAITPALEVSGTNQCNQSNGNCQHFCLPTPLGRTCVCDEKYILSTNGKDCLRSKFEKILLVTDKERSGVFIVDAQTGAYLRMPIYNINEQTGITWDGLTKTYMWASRMYKRIVRACLYPQKCAAVINIWQGDRQGLEGIAVDPFKQHIYIADSSKNLIYRITYEKEAPRVTVVDLNIASPRGLALDLSRRLIFWTELRPNGQIRRASMDDGSVITTLINTDIIAPNDVAVDPKLKIMYWCDGGKKTIELSSLDGGDRKVLYQGTTILLSLTLDDQYIYFSDVSTGSLHRIDRLMGRGLKSVGPSFFLYLYDIIFIDTTKTPQTPIKPATELPTSTSIPVPTSMLSTSTPAAPSPFSSTTSTSTPAAPSPFSSTTINKTITLSNSADSAIKVDIRIALPVVFISILLFITVATAITCIIIKRSKIEKGQTVPPPMTNTCSLPMTNRQMDISINTQKTPVFNMGIRSELSFPMEQSSLNTPQGEMQDDLYLIPIKTVPCQ